MRLKVLVLALLTSLGLSLGGLSPAVATGTPSPLDRLLSPALMDPVIDLFAPLPTPYTPYTGSICQSGDPQCIVDVIAEMEQRLTPLAQSCNHDAIFSLAYLRVTQNVKAAADSGYFRDRSWLTQIDAVFANRYFQTLDAWRSGDRSSIPAAWKTALTSADDHSMSGLGDFMLGMNAHINNDFPYVLAEVGLTGADGVSHKDDHNAYNDRLDALYHPVFDEETARFDPMFNKIDVGPVDDFVVSAIMRGWREIVWRHAEALAHARTPAMRRLIGAEISAYAEAQAQLIRAIPIFRSGFSPTRDAYCAAHHG